MNNDMDWKEMTEQPAEGTFEKIQRRLRVRRALRIGLPAVAVAAVAVVAYLIAVQPAQTEAASTAGSDVAFAMPVPPQAARAGVADRAEEKDEPTTSGQKNGRTFESDLDLSELMPTASPKVTQVQPPSMAGSFSVGSPILWTGDESVTQVERDRLPQEAIDSLFAVENIESQSNNPSPITFQSSLSSKSGEPQAEPYHEDDLLWAPNVIVPSGDVDENRSFSIKTSSTLSQFVIHIYNRRGQRIFSSTDPAFVWDATYDGAQVQQGGYVWVASFRDGEGKARTETGTVVVVR